MRFSSPAGQYSASELLKNLWDYSRGQLFAGAETQYAELLAAISECEELEVLTEEDGFDFPVQVELRFFDGLTRLFYSLCADRFRNFQGKDPYAVAARQACMRVHGAIRELRDAMGILQPKRRTN